MFSIKGCFPGLLASIAVAVPAVHADEVLKTPVEITQSPAFVRIFFSSREKAEMTFTVKPAEDPGTYVVR